MYALFLLFVRLLLKKKQKVTLFDIKALIKTNISRISLLKEVADGLRIYFDFTITDYLLYKEEEEYALSYLSEENLKNFTYIATPVLSMDCFTTKSDVVETNSTSTVIPELVLETAKVPQSGSVNLLENSNNTVPITINSTNVTSSPQEDQPQRRKLRSHRSDDCDLTLENCLSSIASTSSGASTPLHSNIPVSHLNYLKSLPPISPQIRDFLQNLLSWRLLPTSAAPAPAMIFGAAHLARLIGIVTHTYIFLFNKSPINLLWI